MTAKTIALAATVLSLAAMPALACGGAKKSSLQQSSVSTMQTGGESDVIRTIKGNS